MPKVQEGAKYEKKYTEENILSALTAIENGMSQRKASKTFGVPRQTLQFRKSDNFRQKTNLGPNPILTKEEELILEDWILTGYKKGFPIRKLDIQASVKEFLDANPRENPFHDNLPGDGWYRAFLKRHAVLTHRTPEAVTGASSAISESDIRKWFGLVEDYLQGKGLQDILLDPTRMYNGDETCFFLCPKNFKVIAPRGARNVYEVDSGQAKMNITVMFTFSAAGLVTKPMVIYPYKRLPTAIVNSVPTSWGIGHSDNGWMKVELFYEYVGNVLYPFLKQSGIQFPIILFVDGHSTHQTLKLSQLCTSLGIILIALYPNATRIMQPADVAAFKPIKTGWKKAVLEFRRKNPHQMLTKEKFAPILETVVNKYAKEDTIVNGFRASGLFPWNASAIDYSKCLGIQKNDNIKKNTTEENANGDNDPVISYNQFKNIVGDDRIKLFEQIESHAEENDEFILLYKIYKQFRRNENNLDDADSPSETAENIGEDNLLADSLDIENLEIIFEDEILTTILLQEVEILNEPNSESHFDDLHEQPITGINNNEENKIQSEIDKNITEHSNLTKILKNCEETNENVLHNVEDQTVMFLENVDKKENKSLREYVLWPKTPERKGKKESERLPFVLTSTQWKEIQTKKLEAKKQVQDEKENRKIERDLKKSKIEIKKLEKTTATKRKLTISKNNSEAKSESKKKEKRTFPKPIVTKGPLLETSANSLPSTSRIDVSSCVIISPKKHVRRIFSEDESDDSLDDGNEFSSNLTAVGRLCFICTKNITILLKGIKCYECTRTYHNSCIIKLNPDIEKSQIFYCKTCSDKKN